MIELLSDNSNCDDIDLPIGLRKTPHSCTHHPISNFVQGYRDFTSNLNSIKILENIQEVLDISKWREAVMAER